MKRPASKEGGLFLFLLEGKMSKRVSVGIIGATGIVGQNYIMLLQNHPWFEITYVAASPRSAGKSYEEAVRGRWFMDEELPESIKLLTVYDGNNVEDAVGKCSIIFSAVDLPKDEVRQLECDYAERGFAVVSNNSAHRHSEDVPMLIPEVNDNHLQLIEIQRKNRKWTNGCIAVKPNCSIQSYMIPIHALRQAGYRVNKLIVTTLQSLSGAGNSGPSAINMVDNIVPYIGGEEEKSEVEPQKIFGTIENNELKYDKSIAISAHCNRVSVIDGHTACVSMGFEGKVPSENEIKEIWNSFTSPSETLPSAPSPALIYKSEPDRPQPRKDRMAGKGMAITIGRLRPCNVLDYRFTALSHNTIRGAAGGAIFMGELLFEKILKTEMEE